MSNYSIGITPDLTSYANTTKLYLEKWHKVLDHIFEDWEIIKDDYGEVVDAIPEWHVKFKDGSSVVVEMPGKPSEPSIGYYDCKSASERDTQAIINKYHGQLKHVERDYLIAKNNFDEEVAILPRRRFFFKDIKDIVEGLKHIPVVKKPGRSKW